MEAIATRKVLDHGSVSLMDFWGDDERPARIARTSFRNSDADKTAAANHGLADYLIRHRHNTPVEFNEAFFHMVMPILVARQWIRHRTASVNEESLRYIEARDAIWVPDLEDFHPRPENVKQGCDETTVLDGAEAMRELWIAEAERDKATYRRFLDSGLAPEIARGLLPVAQYTAWHWKCDLHNIGHLLSLRMDAHAQKQTRLYANAMFELLCEVWPNLMRSIENHVIKAKRFSNDEMLVLQGLLQGHRDEITDGLVDAGLSDKRIEEFWKKLAH